MITGLRGSKEFADPVMIKRAVRKGTPHSAPTRDPDDNALKNRTRG